jgi:hypothetical protein
MHDAAGRQIHPVDSHPRLTFLALAGSAWSLVVACGRGAIRRLRGFDVLVEAHGAGRAGLVGRLLPFRRITIVHGSEVLLARGWAEKRWRWVMRGSQRVVVTSEATAAHIAALAPDVASRVRVVHPGVPWAQLRELISATDRSVMSVLGVRRVLPLYRTDALLDAVADLQSPLPLRLSLLEGAVPEAASDFAATVRERLSALSPRVDARWVPGTLAKPDFWRLLAGHEIAVSLAESDQASEAILESLATGCILVMSDLEAYAGLRDLDHVFTVPVPVRRDDVTVAMRLAVERAIDCPKGACGERRSIDAERAFRAGWSDDYGSVIAAAISDRG